MTPRRPHFFNAIYDWLLENELTPYVLVDATVHDVMVPQESVQEGEIVLNLAPYAIGNYQMNRDRIEFDARFSGVSQHIYIPMSAIKALYAKENGVGLGFEEEPYYLKELFKEKEEDIQDRQKQMSNKEEKQYADSMFTLVK